MVATGVTDEAVRTCCRLIYRTSVSRIHQGQTAPGLSLLNWRIALPLAAAVIITALVLFTRPSTVAPPPIVQANPANVKTDLDPTISNYHMIANRSLDKFDELLNRQASRNPSPTPIYTASTTTGPDSVD